MSPQDGRGFNCWFHMPFASGARIELVSEMERLPVFFYYYIDYETYDDSRDDLGYFHASFHRENPTDGRPQGDATLATSSRARISERRQLRDPRGRGQRGHFVGSVC